MKLAFITGITGQDGSYLAELLLSKEYKVYGIQRRTSKFNTSRIDHIRSQLIMRYGDMTDSSGLSKLINSIVQDNPEFEVFEIYNLAAQSHVKISFEIPEYTTDTDALGVLRILEIIRTFTKKEQNKIRFYQAGTSELYGKVLETPQTETTPFNPKSPYAAAKCYAYYLTKMYREGYNLFLVNGILFNHESPRRGSNFVTMKVINGVKAIIKGKQEFIELGNLDSQRDWGHAKDYVYGMWLMLQQDEPKDYVLATGECHSVRSFVELAFKYHDIEIRWEGIGENEIGISVHDNIVRIRINPKYFRPCEVDLLLGDARKAVKELGWKREFLGLEDLIVDMF